MKILITGANKGIGFEFTKQYANAEWTVYACCRRPEKADKLQALAKQNSNIQIKMLDVTKTDQIQKLAEELKYESIDILLNNAGIYGGNQEMGNISVEVMQNVFLTNSIAPLKMVEAFVVHVAKSQLKLIVNITSMMGSISQNGTPTAIAYCASKSALNMIMKCVSKDVESRGVGVLLLHPGWVKTDMGGEDAAIDPETSVTGMRKVIDNKINNNMGLFYSYTGEEIPW